MKSGGRRGERGDNFYQNRWYTASITAACASTRKLDALTDKQ